MKNKKQTILIILISVLIILGITAFVLTTTINKTKANTETGTEEGTSTGTGGGHKTGCESYGYAIPCGESCPTCGAQSSSNAHEGGTHSNGGRCTVCGTRYQTHQKSTTIKEYHITSTTHTPIYACTFPDCTGTYDGTAEAHTYV